MWALSCHFPFETSKESLIDHFEEIRLKFNQEKAIATSRYTLMRGGGTASKRLGQPGGQHKEDLVFYDFILSFFRL